ncbi:hypothetical protein GCM10010310_17390 [Streptomyces violaceolatus]|uniref:Uncharacterized protein n=1 Tax=Streptomyces violaceolatus TaxID=67378 RepID=A0ABN3SGI1_9ACTN
MFHAPATPTAQAGGPAPTHRGHDAGPAPATRGHPGFRPRAAHDRSTPPHGHPAPHPPRLAPHPPRPAPASPRTRLAAPRLAPHPPRRASPRLVPPRTRLASLRPAPASPRTRLAAPRPARAAGVAAPRSHRRPADDGALRAGPTIEHRVVLLSRLRPRSDNRDGSGHGVPVRP